MSNVAHLNQDQEVAPTEAQVPQSTHTAVMLMNPQIMGQLQKFAEVMVTGKATVPQHLRGNVGDCMAVTMQAAQWGMNPFAVAQKTHLVNGTLGYEAQLVNAVISSSRAIKGRFKYEYGGDWENQGKKDAWVRVGAVLADEEEITWGEPLYVHLVTTRNSPLWKTNPKQQAAYLAVKYWARLYCPDVILGVYTPDELHDVPPPEREINPIGSGSSQASSLKNRVQKTQSPARAQSETAEAAPQTQQPPMPNFDEPDDASMPPVDELLKHLPNCTTGPDLSEWKQDAMTWPDGSSERQQLVEAYNTHIANLKAQSAEGEQ